LGAHRRPRAAFPKDFGKYENLIIAVGFSIKPGIEFLTDFFIFFAFRFCAVFPNPEGTLRFGHLPDMTVTPDLLAF
jgi:hypothetical protein